MLGNAREAILDVWEGSGGPLGSSGRVVTPTWKSVQSREAR